MHLSMLRQAHENTNLTNILSNVYYYNTEFALFMYLLRCLICPLSSLLPSTETQKHKQCTLLSQLFCCDFTSILFHNSQHVWFLKSGCPTNGCPRPSCLSIITALARMIFPPWVIMDCLSQVTKSGRFTSYIKTKVSHSHFFFAL